MKAQASEPIRGSKHLHENKNANKAGGQERSSGHSSTVQKSSSMPLSRGFCETLLLQAQDSEVSEDVQYTPRKDEDVEPADLPSNPVFSLPETIEIPVEKNLRSFYSSKIFGNRGARGAGATASSGARWASIGTLRVDVASGKIFFNGQPLDTRDQQRILKRCRRLYGLKHSREP